MQTYTMPIGREVLSIRTMHSEKPMPCMNKMYVFAKPGGTYTTDIDGNPILVAVADSNVIFAHTEKVDVIDDIIRELLVCGAPFQNIVMCLQFSIADVESAFIEKAMQTGLRHVWGMHSIAQHPNLIRPHHGKNFFVMRRHGFF